MKHRALLLSAILIGLVLGVGCKSGGVNPMGPAAGADAVAGGGVSYPGTPEGAKAMLNDLLQGKNHDAIVASLRPKDEDYAAAFEAAVADKAQAGYKSLWAGADKVEIKPKPGQTQLLVWSATTEDLRNKTGDAGEFPGGYSAVASQLKPGVAWYRWKFTQPGETLGMAYDGLAYVNGHWAWFPKPWRVVGGSE